jgi:hypothetical protein
MALKGFIMLKKFLMVALTTGLVAKGIQVLVKRADQRLLAERKFDKKAAVQEWENEGGPIVKI